MIDNLVEADYLNSFQNAVNNYFSFLEKDYDFNFSGIREVNDGPRDRGVVARFTTDSQKISIAWSEVERSLVISLKLNLENLSGSKRIIYFEPFVEFISEGKVKPIIPQIYPGMSVTNIKQTADAREKLFLESFDEIVKRLSERLKENLHTILSTKSIDIERYHDWFLNRSIRNEEK